MIRRHSVVVSQTGSSFQQTVQAENYSAMAGVQLEATTDAGGGQNVGWIETGDWMAYNSINIPTTGAYTAEYRVASGASGGIRHRLRRLRRAVCWNSSDRRMVKLINHTVNIATWLLDLRCRRLEHHQESITRVGQDAHVDYGTARVVCSCLFHGRMSSSRPITYLRIIGMNGKEASTVENLWRRR